MTMRTHIVATAAFNAVSIRGDRTNANNPDQKKYGALAHKLPGMILQNGLAQATGFLLAKGKPEHLALLDDLRKVLQDAHATNAENNRSLHQEIIEADLTRTMQLTRHALEAAGWIKRYVQGVLKVNATGENTTQEAQ